MTGLDLSVLQRGLARAAACARQERSAGSEVLATRLHRCRHPRVPQHELSALQRQVRRHPDTFWRSGMRISDDELEAMEPVNAACTDAELIVTLANGQRVGTPLWWYPRLLNATLAQRANFELSPLGVHWPEIDEDLSAQGMLTGVPARRPMR
jgi:hypothetical protein